MGTNKKPAPHPYANVIKSWADGHKIQYKKIGDAQWHDIANNKWHVNFNEEGFDWRIKPNETINEPIIANYFDQFKAICRGIAEGKEIQYRFKGNDHANNHDTWYDGAINIVQRQFNFDFDSFEFRVRPDVKTIRYQCYLYCKEDIIAWASNYCTREEAEADENFERWLGEEQTITIEVEDE